MTRPGVTVQVVDSAPPRSAPTSTAVAFMVGLAERGPLGPNLVTNFAAFRREYGERVPYGLLYDAVETYFREGGSQVYLSRVVGAAAVAASRTLNDGAAVASLKVSAVGPGAWGSEVSVGVTVDGSTFTITATQDGETIDQSPPLADKAAALDWGVTSRYVDVSVAGAGGNPAASAPAAMSGGNDDRAAIVTASWQAALARFGRELGPGQVLAPGASTSVLHGAVLDHAAATNRMALLDAPAASDVGSLTTAATAARAASPSAARLGALWAPWVRIPGLAAGTTRTVPPSPVVAGLIARNEAGGSPAGQPAANRYGLTRSVSSVAATFSPDDTETLYAAGVNVIRDGAAGIMAYGDTSLANRSAEGSWGGFAANRVVMAVAAEGGAVLERHVFDVIDGKGVLMALVTGELTSILAPLYADGSLYGATFGEAARVDLGPNVNTPETIANRELHALIALRTSPAAEMVALELVRTATTEVL